MFMGGTMEKRALKIWVLLQLAFFIGGCGWIQEKIGGPKAVAENFWNATKTGDPEKIKIYVTQASLKNELVASPSKAADQEFTMDRAQIEKNIARIPTTLNNKGVLIKLHTILLKEDGKWKVDVSQTMATLLGGMMGELAKAVGETVASAVQNKMNVKDATHKTGDPVMVEWHGTWYPSTVIDCSNTNCKIHYDGWSNSWDERVTFDRIRRE